MLINSNKTRAVDHVMWQPMFNCRANCSFCYIKYSQVDGNSKDKISSLPLDLIEQGRLQCKQLTISFDYMNFVPQELLLLLKRLYKYYNTATEKPELCLTLFSPDVLYLVAQSLKMSLKEFLLPVNIVSFSLFQIGKLNPIKQAYPLITINYNNLVLSGTILKGQKYTNFDQVYVIYRKEPLGNIVDEDYLHYWKREIESYKKDFGHKMRLDQCVLDCSRVSRNPEANKCGAGITKLAFWPDGSITGCPYDTNLLHPIKNLWKPQEPSEHPMNSCNILETFKNLRKEKLEEGNSSVA